MLVRAIRSFGNKIEGKRVRAGKILEMTEVRFRQLNSNASGIRLVEKVEATVAGPLAKVEPPSRAPLVRQIYPGGRLVRGQEAGIPGVREASKKRTSTPKPARARGPAKQEVEPEVPQRLSTRRGGPTGAAPAPSSSPAGQAPKASTSRPRGTRTPKSGGSPSTGPQS